MGSVATKVDLFWYVLHSAADVDDWSETIGAHLTNDNFRQNLTRCEYARVLSH